MTSGEVNFPVSTGESGNNLYLKVVDGATGNAITQGVCVSGSYNLGPTPKNWLGQAECQPGRGTSISLLTDKTGLLEWAFPATCPSSFSLICQTPGYQDELVQFSTGIISGPVNVQVSMLKGTMGQLAQAPPACLALQADLNQSAYGAKSAVTGVTGGVSNFLTGMSLYVVIGLVLLAVILIVLALLFRPGVPSVGVPK